MEAMRLEIMEMAKERDTCHARAEQLCAAETAQMARIASLTEDLSECQAEAQALRKELQPVAPELEELREQRRQVEEELRKAEMLWSKLPSEQNLNEVRRPRRLSTVSLPLAQACRSQSLRRHVEVQTSIHQSPQAASSMEAKRGRAVSAPPEAETGARSDSDAPSPARSKIVPGADPKESQPCPTASDPRDQPMSPCRLRRDQDAMGPQLAHYKSLSTNGVGTSQSLRLCAELDANSVSASWQASPTSRKLLSRSSSASRSPGSVSTARTAALNPVIRSRSHSPVRRLVTGRKPTLSLPSREVLATRSMPMPCSTTSVQRTQPALAEPAGAATARPMPAPEAKPVVLTQQLSYGCQSASRMGNFPPWQVPLAASMGPAPGPPSPPAPPGLLTRTRRCVVATRGNGGPQSVTFASCRSWSPVRVEPDLVAGRAWLSPNSKQQDPATLGWPPPKDESCQMVEPTTGQTLKAPQPYPADVAVAEGEGVQTFRASDQRSRCFCEDYCGPVCS